MNIYADTERLKHDLKTRTPEAYKYLFSTYYPRLQRYALHFVADIDAVEDILQDSFLKLWERQDAICFTSVQALLFRMVRNNCLNYLRNEAVKTSHIVDSAETADTWERIYHADLLDNPEYELLYEELKQQIDEVLNELPERTKEIFEISRFEGLKNREIAERLGISIKIVERHISRALKLLNERFKDLYPYCIEIMLIEWLTR